MAARVETKTNLIREFLKSAMDVEKKKVAVFTEDFAQKFGGKIILTRVEEEPITPIGSDPSPTLFRYARRLHFRWFPPISKAFPVNLVFGITIQFRVQPPQLEVRHYFTSFKIEKLIPTDTPKEIESMDNFIEHIKDYGEMLDFLFSYSESSNWLKSFAKEEEDTHLGKLAPVLCYEILRLCKGTYKGWEWMLHGPDTYTTRLQDSDIRDLEEETEGEEGTLPEEVFVFYYEIVIRKGEVVGRHPISVVWYDDVRGADLEVGPQHENDETYFMFTYKPATTKIPPSRTYTYLGVRIPTDRAGITPYVNTLGTTPEAIAAQIEEVAKNLIDAIEGSVGEEKEVKQKPQPQQARQLMICFAVIYITQYLMRLHLKDIPDFYDVLTYSVGNLQEVSISTTITTEKYKRLIGIHLEVSALFTKAYSDVKIMATYRGIRLYEWNYSNGVSDNVDILKQRADALRQLLKDYAKSLSEFLDSIDIEGLENTLRNQR